MGTHGLASPASSPHASHGRLSVGAHKRTMIIKRSRTT